MPIPHLRKTMMPTPTGGVQEVRKFSNASLQTSINNALAGVGPNSKSAVLNLEKNEEGLNVAVAARLNDHWSIAGAWRREDWGDALATTLKFDW